jgi:putative ABC transport system permease protein
VTVLRALLRLIGLRRLRETPAQSLRAAAAVMVAVGAVISCWLVTTAIARGVAEGLEAFAGRTALRLAAGEAGLPERLLDAVRAVPGVEAAVPLLESPAYVVGSEGEVLTVFGLDLDEEDRVRHYTAAVDGDEVVDDPLVFLSQPNSIILTRAWAERHGFRRDDALTLQTPQGRRVFVVRGLLDPRGPALAFGGALALMDYQAAQLAFAKRDRLDEIDVLAGPHTDVEALAEALRALVGSGVRVEAPGAFAAETAVATRSVAAVFWLLSALVVIVAMFLLYNAITMTVARRGEEIALLRALGVRRAETVRLILLEAAVLGAAGALAGLPFGATLARLMLRSAGTSVRTALLTPLDTASIAPIGALGAAGAIAVGLVVTLVAAWRPARQAARFVPAAAARRGAILALREARLPSPWWAAVCLAVGAGAVGLAFASGSSAIGPVADAALVVAAALVAPAIVQRAFPFLARLLRPLGAVGELAALGVAASPQRSALTATPLMVAVALVVVVATMQRSFRVTFDEWMAGFGETTLQIASMSQDPSRAVLLSEPIVRAIASVPGVGTVHRFRFVHASYAGRRIAIEYNDYDPADPARGHVRFRRGDPAEAFARLAAGEAVVVSENFAMHFGVGPGEVLRLPTPGGVRVLPIVATAANYNGDQGSIMMARRLFTDLFGDPRVQFVLAEVRPGADMETTRAAIAARYGEEYQLVIFTLAELRRDIAARIDRAFLPSSALLLLAVVVGCLGIANALAVAVEERQREVGTLRALGARRRDITRLVVGEATVLGLLGVVLGLGLGVVLSYLWVVVHVRHLLGWIIGYHFAPAGAALGIAAALVVAPVAAWWPARRAARLSPVRALASE